MKTKSYKNLIVGCGITGATLARKIAEELNKEVLIIDQKDHIAGNCYDYWDKNGICVHQYGTHIFHTNLKPVWEFVSRFTKWYPYQHKVLGLIDGQYVPIPFNLNSLRQVFPASMADTIEQKLIEHFGFNVKVPILELRKTGEKDLVFLADYIYQKIFLEYTLKQWGMTPEELDPSVSGRVPVYISRDDRYFQDKYQGIPLKGYTELIAAMLDHPQIKVVLNTPYSPDIKCERLFYTGPIDEFFNYQLGELPYRSIRLDFVEFPYERFQEASVINYPTNYDWTRIGEYKWFLNNQSENTVVSYEYPEAFEQGKNERYYPIIKEENLKLHQAYLDMAGDSASRHFLGRLGDYKYYDMDKAVDRALSLFEKIK